MNSYDIIHDLMPNDHFAEMIDLLSVGKIPMDYAERYFFIIWGIIIRNPSNRENENFIRSTIIELKTNYQANVGKKPAKQPSEVLVHLLKGEETSSEPMNVLISAIFSMFPDMDFYPKLALLYIIIYREYGNLNEPISPQSILCPLLPTYLRHNNIACLYTVGFEKYLHRLPTLLHKIHITKEIRFHPNVVYLAELGDYLDSLNLLPMYEKYLAFEPITRVSNKIMAEHYCNIIVNADSKPLRDLVELLFKREVDVHYAKICFEFLAFTISSYADIIHEWARFYESDRTGYPNIHLAVVFRDVIQDNHNGKCPFSCIVAAKLRMKNISHFIEMLATTEVLIRNEALLFPYSICEDYIYISLVQVLTENNIEDRLDRLEVTIRRCKNKYMKYKDKLVFPAETPLSYIQILSFFRRNMYKYTDLKLEK